MRRGERLGRRLRQAILGLAALALAGCEPLPPPPAAPPPGGAAAGVGAAPPAGTVRTAAEQREGDRAHREVVEHFGGAYRDPRLAAYVSQVGQRVAAVSGQPGARWTFTVLDSPTINAFAIPGGYVYVTRGLVALAGDEAQLAGVLGHEVGHVVAGHSALRRERTTTASLGLLAGMIGLAVAGVDPQAAGAILDIGQAAAGGYLAAHSRSEELEADDLGVRYLARAGYDPYAQAEFLDRLTAWSALQARIAGGSYDANRVDFFSSHPATAERTRQAIGLAQGAGPGGTDRGRDRLLAAIDGIVWGDSPRQGFVRGRTFSHPELGFTFTVPPGFTITNSAEAVVARGPRDAHFIFDGVRDPGVALTDYIARGWAPAIAQKQRVGPLQGLAPDRINGLEAARAVLPVELRGRAFDALLVAVRLGGRVYRMTGLAPRGSGLLPALGGAAETFRPLSPAEAAALQPSRIQVVTVQAGETVETLARRMNVDGYALERFRVLNGLGPGEIVRPGDRVKLVR